MERIKFYSETDLSVSWYLKDIENIYNDYNPKDKLTLPYLLELYNCTIYIDKKLFLRDSDIELLEDTNKIIKRKITEYFNDVGNFKNIDVIRDVPNEYKDDFLTLLFRYKMDDKLGEGTIELWIKDNIFNYYILCKNKKFVKKYDEILKSLILNTPSSAEMILKKYMKSGFKEEKIYLPYIDNDSMNKLFEKYIESDRANPNYLTLIVNSRDINEFRIDSLIKLKAKRRENEILTEHFKRKGSMSKYNYVLKLEKGLNAPISYEFNDKDKAHIIKLDRTILEADQRYFSIIYNFIYLFRFIDTNGRIPLVNLKFEGSVFEHIIGVQSQYSYNINAVFRSKEIMSQLKLTCYYELLNYNGVELERVLEWYFRKHIKEEYNINNFKLELPSKESKYSEKCLGIFSQIEYVLNQFAKLVTYEHIDQELIAIDSNSVQFKHIPSLIRKKYIYASDKMTEIMHYLFSNQGHLGYIDDNLNDENFFALIMNNEVKLNQFRNYQKDIILDLLKQGFIITNEDEIIAFENPIKINLLNDLYENEVIVYKRLSEEFKYEVDDLLTDKYVESASSLFSSLEQDYYNYYLNNHEYQNGMQLRNKYLHGRQVNLTEEKHKENYLIGMKLLVCITLKINEDFCYAADEEII